jgi:hypothetical protein
MNDALNQTFAKLRQTYPFDIAQIEQEEARVADLLKMQEYASQPVTQELMKLCRADVLFARTRLATNRKLEETARRELWAIIDARLWFLQIVSKDFDGEIAAIEAQLRADLEP